MRFNLSKIDLIKDLFSVFIIIEIKVCDKNYFLINFVVS